jgi:hypothetical protein
MGEQHLSAYSTAEVVTEDVRIDIHRVWGHDFGYRGGKIYRERAISLMSRPTQIYTTYGLLSTTPGLGVRHTG